MMALDAQVDGQAICLKCRKTFKAGDTSTMNKHVKNSADHKSSKAAARLRDGLTAYCFSHPMVSVVEVEVVKGPASTPAPASLAQSSIMQFKQFRAVDKEEQRAIDRCIALMVAEDYLPLSVVEGAGFQVRSFMLHVNDPSLICIINVQFYCGMVA
jgi:hypothetical protein